MSRPLDELSLRLVDIPELPAGECSRGVRAHARRDQIANPTLEMKRDFLVHVAVGARDAKESSYSLVFRHARAPKGGCVEHCEQRLLTGGAPVSLASGAMIAQGTCIDGAEGQTARMPKGAECRRARKCRRALNAERR